MDIEEPSGLTISVGIFDNKSIGSVTDANGVFSILVMRLPFFVVNCFLLAVIVTSFSACCLRVSASLIDVLSDCPNREAGTSTSSILATTGRSFILIGLVCKLSYSGHDPVYLSRYRMPVLELIQQIAVC